MARIRTIKPEFFTSADIVGLTPITRLFYIALWCEADRAGRLKWDVRTLKLRYLPGDNCDVEAVAQELIDAGMVILYEVDGIVYAEIPSFERHQVINNREKESAIPERVDASQRQFHASGTRHDNKVDANNEQKINASQQSCDASGTRESGVKAEGKGREGKGKEDSESKDSGGSPPDPSEFIFGFGLPLLVNSGTAEKQARSFLGLLRKRAGDEEVVRVLQRCADEKPLQPLEWLAAALPAEQSQKRKPEPPGVLDDPHPQWALDAGFVNRFEAENARCFERNAHEFRDGRRVAA